MMNNLESETIRVCHDVKNWANVLDFLGVEFHAIDDTGPLFLLTCPACKTQRAVTLTIKGRSQQYPRWNCKNCLAERGARNHNSFLCLLKLLLREFKNVEMSEGQILGQIECFLLGAVTYSKEFFGGDYVLDFGQYKGFKLKEVPLNYIRYLSEPKHSGLNDNIKNDIRKFLGLPLLTNKPMNVISF